MTTTTIKTESVCTSSLKTDDVWAVVNKTDELVAVGLGKYKTKARYVGMFETLEDDDDDVDIRFDNLLKENKDMLVQLNSTYTVVRSTVEK
jgi:hypothetical protein